MPDNGPSVNDLVRHRRWTGRVYRVLGDGSVLIDWSGHTQGFDHPFFHGPYRPEEVELVSRTEQP